MGRIRSVYDCFDIKSRVTELPSTCATAVLQSHVQQFLAIVLSDCLQPEMSRLVLPLHNCMASSYLIDLMDLLYFHSTQGVMCCSDYLFNKQRFLAGSGHCMWSNAILLLTIAGQ